MDGRQVITELEREGIDVRRIVLAGAAEVELPAGIRWLPKPVDRDALLAEIAAACS